MVELDFQTLYGIDLSTPGLMRSRSWRWLSLRIVGLLSVPGSRLQRDLYPKNTPRSLYPLPADQLKTTQ